MSVSVVTGATGMIGIALVNAIVNSGDEVYAVVRPNSSKLNLLPESKLVHVVECDASNYPELCDSIQRKCDYFYHLAWVATGNSQERNMSIRSQALNIVYTIDALNAASSLGCERFIGAGSQAEFGVKDQPKISPSDVCIPVQPYGIAKYAAGRLAMERAKALGIDCAWVRVFSVYGEHDRQNSLISYIVNSLLSGDVPQLTPAQQIWDYLYEADAGDAFKAIGENAKGSAVYCLGSGVAKTIESYAEEIRMQIDPTLRIGVGALEYPEGCIMNLCADIDEVSHDTGWRPKFSFSEGIASMLDNKR